MAAAGKAFGSITRALCAGLAQPPMPTRDDSVVALSGIAYTAGPGGRYIAHKIVDFCEDFDGLVAQRVVHFGKLLQMLREFFRRGGHLLR